MTHYYRHFSASQMARRRIEGQCFWRGHQMTVSTGRWDSLPCPPDHHLSFFSELTLDSGRRSSCECLFESCSSLTAVLTMYDGTRLTQSSSIIYRSIGTLFESFQFDRCVRGGVANYRCIDGSCFDGNSSPRPCLGNRISVVDGERPSLFFPIIPLSDCRLSPANLSPPS